MTNPVINFIPEQLQTLAPYKPGMPIGELRRNTGIKSIIKLASNENPLGPSPKAIAAIERSLSRLSLYPDSRGNFLKRPLARNLGVPEEQITLGNGSDQLLRLVAHLFLTYGAESLMSQYTFAAYPIVTQTQRAEVISIPVIDWKIDLDGMLAAITDKTRVIFIANPENPTGQYIPLESLQRFIKAVPNDIVIVIDEAYFEYVRQPDYQSCAPLVSEHPNLIVTRTFSKVYGLAGARIGYCVSAPEIAGILNRIRMPFNVNSPALTAAKAALEDDQHIEASIALNTEQYDFLYTAYQDLGCSPVPSVTNFITVDFGQDAAPIYQSLLSHGIITRPLKGYGLANHLRISIGTAVENKRLIESLNQILQGDLQ